MMNILLMTAGSLFGFLVLFFVLFSLMSRALAKHNLFFTLNKEGEGKIIVHNGAFDRAIMKYKGFCFDNRWNVVPDKRREQFKTKEEARVKYPNSTWDGKKRRKEDKWWYKLYDYFMGGGLEFVGLWPFYSVFRYDFRWEALKQGKSVLHEENLDYVFVKSAPYSPTLKGVETKSMVPLDLELALTIRVVNPYRALFREHQWWEFSVGRLEAYIRQYIPAIGLEFEQLVAEKQFIGSSLFQFLERPGLTLEDKARLRKYGLSEEEIKEFEKKAKLTPEDKTHLRENGLSEKEIEEIELTGRGILYLLRETYGIDVQGIEFASITPAGTAREKYEEAAAKEWSAKKEKVRVVIEASAEAEKIDIIAKAEAGKIKTVSEAIKEQGEVGMAIKAMDTIKEASAKPGNWMFFPSNLLDFLKKFGGKEKKGGDKK